MPYRGDRLGSGIPAGDRGGARAGAGGALGEGARPGGLGLITELADHVRFSNRPGRGAEVSFDKILKWREGALLKVS
ncbi:hypothetical protein GCM10020254_44780 [Streptomyces goshikiensis]